MTDLSSAQLDYINEQKDNLMKIQNDHVQVIKFISSLKYNSTKEVFVPVSEGLAYFKGNIINAKECKVYLGDDYFLSTTNPRALKILDNRKSKIEKLLDDVNMQLENFNLISSNQSLYSSEPTDPNLKKLVDDTYEIVENLKDEEIPENKRKTESKFDDIQQRKIKEKMNLMLKHKNTPITNQTLKEEEIEELKPKTLLESTQSREKEKEKKKVVTAPQSNIVKSKKKKVHFNIDDTNIVKENKSSTQDETKRSIFFMENDDDDY